MFRAEDVHTKLHYAIKEINKKKIKDNELKFIMDELEINKQIAHINVLQAKDILEDDKNYYIVMQLCEGGDLLASIKQQLFEEKDAIIVIE